MARLPFFDEQYTVVGPYLNSKGRRYVKIFKGPTSSGKPWKNTNYSRYLMENKLGRFLTDDEQVDHKDRDKTNDDLDNLQILNKGQHQRIDAKRVKHLLYECANCAKSISRTPAEIRKSANKNHAGPFCSMKCCGEYSGQVRRNEAYLPPQKHVDLEYYYLDKSLVSENKE